MELLMKKIEAIIRPYKWEDVRQALATLDITTISIMEIQSLNQQATHTEIYRGQKMPVDFSPKIKIELIVHDALLDDAITLIMDAARTGRIGDGKLFVSDIKKAYRIRTGEHDEETT